MDVIPKVVPGRQIHNRENLNLPGEHTDRWAAGRAGIRQFLPPAEPGPYKRACAWRLLQLLGTLHTTHLSEESSD